MTLLWFGLIIFGFAGLLWLIDWLFDRGEVDSQPYIDGVPVDTIHVDLWPADVMEMQEQHNRLLSMHCETIESALERDRR